MTETFDNLEYLSRWSEEEHERYILFAKFHYEILKTSYGGKKRNIFLRMSEFICTKHPR